MWHFSNNEDSPKNERTFKMKVFLHLVLSQFIAANKSGENIVIDKSMILFRGRLKFRQQYMPGKAHKFGIKLFKVCDPKCYTYRIIVYPGKSETVSTNLTTDTVMKLVQDIDAGRTVCTDNYYTNLHLANQLLDRRTHLNGTLRATGKGLPKSVMSAKLKKGEVIGLENSSGIVVIKWKDKRNVYFLSTKHEDVQVNTGKQNKQKENIAKPEAIMCYNVCKIENRSFRPTLFLLQMSEKSNSVI